ncbi:RING-type domain-containing protein [Caenorhabditis elegans]|uniref:RING-type domain-containing protein n=1 Tax=Caenorhabditis elegans TaxID=6239 RepID=Q18355_CAEEL|nr:RING-type domain-containing protein [Caenorhabditis elegans]CCD66039.2 RING-type domain-containing protein [Caenorhabditis elegans]
MGDSGVEPVIPSPSTSSNNPVEELQCTICLSTRFSQECRIEGCNHSFCFSCISEWVCQSLRPSCPMCRKDVDKVSYDFSEQKLGQKEIAIKEYRSGHMSLTPTDRVQLLSERRLVVRNLMHSYKVVGLLSSEISGIEESKEPDEILKNALIELAAIVTQHIQKAEISLSDLRTEQARINKSIVFNTVTFRRMVYTSKVKVMYPDLKKVKIKPSDIAREPDRFRNVITNFLIAEFDAIPFQNQPKLAGHKWRTKFLGSCIDMQQKQRYAAQIYELMLSRPSGDHLFRRELNEILTPVSAVHIQFLDDHLDAIIAIEKLTIEEFYNEVYYDSIYNSFSSNFFDYNSMGRDDPQSRFEALFNQIHRDIGSTNDWMDTYVAGRLLRQSSNTDGTDRATNNDDDSDRSESPEERVPTPMPDEDPREQSLARAYYEQMLEMPNRVPLSMRAYHMMRDRDVRVRYPTTEEPVPVEPVTFGQTTRTLPISQQPTTSRSHMTLRSAMRRLDSDRPTDEEIPPIESRPQTRREIERDRLLQRVREFDNRSRGLSSLFRHPASSDYTSRRFTSDGYSGLVMLSPRLNSTTTSSTSIPVYQPRTMTSNDFAHLNRTRSILERRHFPQPPREQRIEEVEQLFNRAYQNMQQTHQAIQEHASTSNAPTQIPRPATPAPAISDEESRSLAEIVATINQEDADNGLDFISVAHRTRSARRAAENGHPPEGPPAKRSTNSRRDRR